MARKALNGTTATATARKASASVGGGRSKAAKPKSACAAAGEAVASDTAKKVEDGYHQIAAKAYEIYCERVRTGAPGDAHSDWLAAEAALRGA